MCLISVLKSAELEQMEWRNAVLLSKESGESRGVIIFRVPFVGGGKAASNPSDSSSSFWCVENLLLSVANRFSFSVQNPVSTPSLALLITVHLGKGRLS